MRTNPKTRVLNMNGAQPHSYYHRASSCPIREAGVRACNEGPMKRKPNDVLSCGPESVLPDDGIPAVVMWDINSPDSARARAFYRDVFGWKVSEPGAPPVRLATVESGGI